MKIPELMKATPHTFFFVDYEGNRRRLVTPLFLNVPTAAMRSGNLRRSCVGVPGGSIVNPFTGQPFPNNTIPVCNQPGCISPVAQSLLNNYYTALPNSTIQGANSLQQTATPSNTNGYDVRIDHTITAKQSLYGRWSSKSISSTIPNPLLPSDRDKETDHNLILSHRPHRDLDRECANFTSGTFNRVSDSPTVPSEMKRP